MESHTPANNEHVVPPCAPPSSFVLNCDGQAVVDETAGDFVAIPMPSVEGESLLPPCPKGFHREGDSCVRDETPGDFADIPTPNHSKEGEKACPACPMGNHLEGDKCVPDLV